MRASARVYVQPVVGVGFGRVMRGQCRAPAVWLRWALVRAFHVIGMSNSPTFGNPACDKSLDHLCPSTLSPPTSNLQSSNHWRYNLQHQRLHPPTFGQPASTLFAPPSVWPFNQPALSRVQPFNQPAFSRALVQQGLFAIPVECCRSGWSAQWCHAWQSDTQCVWARMLRVMLAPASALFYQPGIACPCCHCRMHAHTSIYSLRALVQAGLAVVAAMRVVVVGAALSCVTLGRVRLGRTALHLQTRQATSLEQGAH